MKRSASLCLLACALLCAAALRAQPRPNLVLLLADDHAAHALSAYRAHLPYGAVLPPTPHLDRLAASGMLFTNAFVTNSICAPSRAAMLTGQYGHLNGVMTNAEALDPARTTFPALLQQAGYETALFGKWHLKAPPSGFSHYELLSGQGPYYNPRLQTARDTTAYTGYTNSILTDRALAWLEHRDTARPFLLMLHFNAPHRFWDPGPDELGLFRDTVFAEPPTLWDTGGGRAFRPEETEMTLALDLFPRDLKLEAPTNLTPEQLGAWNAAYEEENRAYHALGLQGEADLRWRYQRYIKDYMRAVLGLDAAVGRVLDALDAVGLGGSTLVVYTSDQGFFLGDHGLFDKRWMYDESLRVPLLVRWPGTVAPGMVSAGLVMNIDLAPTFLEAAGTTAPAQMQGRSLLPLLRGQQPTDWRAAIYYHYHAYPDWHMVPRHYGVRTARYKLIHYYERNAWELFDLARDPDEMQSAYDDPQYGGVVEGLKAQLGALQAQYAVPANDPAPHLPFEAPPGFRRSEREE